MAAILDQFSVDVLAKCIADLPNKFHTRDVSECPQVAHAHTNQTRHRNYHAHVGRVLKRSMSTLGISEVAPRQARGSLWEKVLIAASSTDECATSNDTLTTRSKPLDLGPQHSTDNSFTATMRKHQSWYRASVLRVPCGVGPTAKSKNHFGNMLCATDGDRGLNFLSDAAFQVAKARIAEGHGAVDEFRLLNNMLSSMPLCFNLFGHLAADLTLATRLLRSVLPNEILEVTAIHLEFTPKPTAEYLNDRTAFDAFFEYRRTDGKLCAVGIETKLTEPFSQKVYDRPEYRRWMASPDSPWMLKAKDHVQRMEHNQLWRDHLLAIAMRDHSKSPYETCRLAVVHHPLDIHCSSVLDTYAKLLKPDDTTLLRWPMDHLLEQFESASDDQETVDWLSAFKLRYLDL